MSTLTQPRARSFWLKRGNISIGVQDRPSRPLVNKRTSVSQFVRYSPFRRSRSWTLLIVILIIACLAFVSRWAPYLVPILSGRLINNIDTHALDIWLQHVGKHPVKPLDRYGLREMGFRTRTYADLLIKDTLRGIDELELSMWNFAPGAKSIRKSALGTESKHHLRFSRQEDTTRGIVMCANKANAFDTLRQIARIRKGTHSNDSIEIFFHGDQRLSPGIQQVFGTLPNVRVVDLKKTLLLDESEIGLESLTIERQLACTAFALLISSFKEIIYINEDAHFLEDPSILFSTRDYRETGTLFFRQHTLYPVNGGRRLLNLVHNQLDQGHPSETLAQSAFWNLEADNFMVPSVLVVDKSRPQVLAALFLNAWLHSSKVRTQLWHTHYRDTISESMWLAFELAQVKYRFVSSNPGTIGTLVESVGSGHILCSARPLHFISRSRGGIQHGRPVWIQQKLMDGTLQTSSPAQDSRWSSTGVWGPHLGKWCTTSSDSQPLESLGMDQFYKNMISIDNSAKQLYSKIWNIFESDESVA